MTDEHHCACLLVTAIFKIVLNLHTYHPRCLSLCSSGTSFLHLSLRALLHWSSSVPQISSQYAHGSHYAKTKLDPSSSPTKLPSRTPPIAKLLHKYVLPVFPPELIICLLLNSLQPAFISVASPCPNHSHSVLTDSVTYTWPP